MKYPIAFVLLALSAIPSYGQYRTGEIAEAYPGFSLVFHGQADVSDGIVMPSLVGRINHGERFGVMIHAESATKPVIEILGEKNVVLKAITANDLLGRATDGTVKLIGSGDGVSGRYERRAYDVALQGGKSVRLIVKALATGDPGSTSAAHPLIITYALSGDGGQKLALRLRLPIEGMAETSPSGFIVSARRSPSAFVAVVSPRPQQMDLTTNVLSITSQPALLDGAGSETPLLWMQIDGASGGSLSAARDQAGHMLNAPGSATGPNVIVVSAVDKSNVNPADTVSMTLICVNVGSQSVSGVTLKNPVPPGTAYLANSAGGEGMEVGYDHAIATDGGVGEINGVRWNMSGSLKPGEDRVARFKAIVR
ncbi:MAG: hypothetical protein ABIR47_15185 [Candidatus Kapaibacterium sp.]